MSVQLANPLEVTVFNAVAAVAKSNTTAQVGQAAAVELLTAIRQLVSAEATHLLGSTAEEQALIDEYLSFARNEFIAKQIAAEPIDVVVLTALNQHLLKRVFVAKPYALTVADVVLYVALHSVLSKTKNIQDKMPNVCRWCDHIQNHPSLKNILPTISFRVANLEVFNVAAFATSFQAPTVAASPVAQASSSSSSSSSAASAAPAAEPKADEKAEKKAKKEKAEKKEAAPAPAAAADEDSGDGTGDLIRCEIRVGKIVSIANHPDAESLYVEQINFGDKTLQVVSGLRNFVPVEQMQDRMVVVMTNLKPGNLRGQESKGMVLCASSEDGKIVEPILPPANAVVGERITFPTVSYDGKEVDAAFNPKKLHKLLKELHTDANGVCQFKNLNFTTSAGPVVSSLKNVPVK